MVYFQSFRTNDIIEDAGKQIEFGKGFMNACGWTAGEIPVTLKFISLSTSTSKLNGREIKTTFKVRGSERGGDRIGVDCKEYSYGAGYGGLKDFFINTLHLKYGVVGKCYFVMESTSADNKHFNLYYVDPSVNAVALCQRFHQKPFDVIAGVPDSTDGTKKDSIKEYLDLLLENHNLILTGAPGTGKTYLAKEIAAAMIGKCSSKDLTSNQKEQIGFVQFHPSYDYTDFVEGLRPVEGGEFVRQDGIFKEFCKRAIRTSSDPDDALQYLKEDIKVAGSILIPYYDSDGTFKVEIGDRDNIIVYPKSGKENQQSATDERIKEAIVAKDRVDKNSYTYYISLYVRRRYMVDNFVFIIDEINRGELSKIFGELFYSIEPDYRGKKGLVKTQYNAMVRDTDIFKSGFYVPENVYIIGTMNDVDRSVESMDFAIRRRFVWKEVSAAESANNMGIEGLALAKMNALNKALGDNDLPEAYWIGGAYFRNVTNNDFEALWNLRLKGVVSEYFRGDPEAPRKLKEVEEKFFAAKLDEAADDGDSTEEAESSETK